MKLRSDPLLCEGQLVPRCERPSETILVPEGLRAGTIELYQNQRSPLRASPEVLAQYVKGYARLCLSAMYRFPGIRRIAVSLFPEHRLQLLRRWLDKF
jgi:hypothetical protein